MHCDAKIMQLSSIADAKAGYPFRGAVTDVRDGPVRVLQIRDVSSEGVADWSGVLRTALGGRREPEWVIKGDLVFVVRGTHYFAAVIDNIPGPTVFGPHLFHLRLKKKVRVLPRFLAWQLNQPPIQRCLHQAAEGSNQLSIRRAELESLPIGIPSMTDQQRIVDLAELAARERMLLGQLIRNREQELGRLAFALAGPTGAGNN